MKTYGWPRPGKSSYYQLQESVALYQVPRSTADSLDRHDMHHQEDQNTQVVLISQIYTLKSSVSVFLGKGTENNDICLDFQKIYAKDEFAIQN